MNNWITISNIFLGLGSVSLSCALFNFLILTQLTSHPYPIYIALTLLMPLFILTILAYVVGFLDYFARKRNTTREQNTVKTTRRHFSRYTNPSWSLHIGAFSTPVLLALQLGETYSRFSDNNIIFILGIPSPMFVSVIAGAGVGLISLALLYFWNHR